MRFREIHRGKLIEVANYKVFGINLRPPFVDFRLIQQLMQQCDFVKMNESELGQALSYLGKNYSQTGGTPEYQSADFQHFKEKLKAPNRPTILI